MITNEITMRQFFEAVIASDIAPAYKEKAKAEITKLDAANAKRAEKAKAKAVEYEPIKKAILDSLLPMVPRPPVRLRQQSARVSPRPLRWLDRWSRRVAW